MIAPTAQPSFLNYSITQLLNFLISPSPSFAVKIAIIGAGNMGSAIASSLTDRDDLIVCTARSLATLHRLKSEMPTVETTDDNRAAVADADIVVLAVKPYVAPAVIDEIRCSIKPGAIVASVIADTTIAELRAMLADEQKRLRIFRVIPNTAIRERESVTFIAHDLDTDASAVATVEEIFSLSGEAIIVAEKDMAACTAMASCGIALFLRFIRAAAEGGVELGLPAPFATRIAALTARGAASVLRDGSHPEAEIDKVTTPGGITIRGLNAMEAHGFTPAVIAALRACCPAKK